MLGADVESVDVVENAVVGFADDGQRPVHPFSACLHLRIDECIAHHANAVGVGQCDGGGELAGFANPLQSGEFAAAVEPVGAREDGFDPDIGMRDDDRDAGVHGRRSGFVESGMPDEHAGDIGDGVVGTGRMAADDDAQISGSHVSSWTESEVDSFFP